MNDERDTTDIEPLVSQTYRETATERVPERLSEKILHAAANGPTKQQQQSAYGFASSWLRPAAWAATIFLSLAIVLQITQDPAPQVAQPAVSINALTADAVADRLEEANVDANAPAEQSRLNKMRAPAAIPAELKAENMMRKRSDANLQKQSLGNVAKPAVGIKAARANEKESDATEACDSETRETAESWFACIQMMRDTGRAAEAASEYNKFTLKFPDFALD